MEELFENTFLQKVFERERQDPNILNKRLLIKHLKQVKMYIWFVFGLQQK